MTKPASIETRELALATYAMTGNCAEAERVTGVDDATIAKWVARSPEDVQRIRQQLQARFVPKLLDLEGLLLTKLGEAQNVVMATGRDVQAMAIAAGIILDKAALLLGIANRVEIEETMNVNVTFPDLDAKLRSIDERKRQLRGLATDIVIDAEGKILPEDGRS